MPTALTSAAGGMCITADALKTADIIVTTAPAAISVAIRAATGGVVSHAMIYAGNGQVIEAITQGVVRRSLSIALARATLAVAYRHRNMSPARAAAVIRFAQRQIHHGYDYLGIAGQAGQQPRVRGVVCQLNPVCHVLFREGGRRLQDSRRFFCSELVAEAYRSAGLPIVAGSSNTASPQTIVHASASGRLIYVGHLVT